MLCEAKQSHLLSSPCSCHMTLSPSVWTNLLGSCCSFLFVVAVSSFIHCISAKALSVLWIRDFHCLEELCSMKPWCCLSYHSINTHCTGPKFFRIIWCIWHGPDSVKDACGYPTRDVAGAEVLSRTWGVSSSLQLTPWCSTACRARCGWVWRLLPEAPLHSASHVSLCLLS